MLPCDISPMEPGDDVFMVLWFREGDGEGEPLYRLVIIVLIFSEDLAYSILFGNFRMVRASCIMV